MDLEGAGKSDATDGGSRYMEQVIATPPPNKAKDAEETHTTTHDVMAGLCSLWLRVVESLKEVHFIALKLSNGAHCPLVELMGEDICIHHPR
jgi:hypothetical protein